MIRALVVVVVLLFVCRDSSAQGCSPAPSDTLVSSTGALQTGSHVPVVQQTDRRRNFEEMSEAMVWAHGLYSVRVR